MSAAVRVPRGRRAAIHLPALGLWTVGLAIFFAPLLLGTAHIANGDFSGQFHAFGLFQMREMAAGRFPLWSPGSLSGFPFAADPQSAAFYPPRWITILLSLPWRFPYYALQLEAVAHVWLAGAFTYLLAYDMTGRRVAALTAAAAFGLGGYLTSYPILQLAILETIAWLPLALLLLRRAVVHERGAPPLVAAGLVLGLSALAGHPQTLLHVAYAAAAYYLFLVWRARWRWPAVAKGGLLLAGIGLGLSAAALLPTARYVAVTNRADVTYAFVSTGFPLLDYLQMAVPGALTLWSPQYVGLVALVFAALALAGRRRAPAADPAPAGGVARSEIAFWGIVALLAAWLSLGDNGILFQLAHRFAPGFSFFRQQERLVGLFSLAVALLAAQGVALWLRDDGRERPRLSGAEGRALLLAGGLLLLAGITLAAMREQVDGGWRLVWLRQCALLIPPAVLLMAGRRRSGAAVFVLLLLTVDLFFAVRPAHVMSAGPPSLFWPRPAWLEPLQDDRASRLDSQNLFHANLGEIYDLQDIRGISPLKPALVERYEELPRRLRWQLLNVTHVLAREPLEEGLTPVAPIVESIIPGETLPATVYRFDDARPRAWLSYEPVIAPDDAAALAAVRSPHFDAARQVVLLPEAATAAATVVSGQGAVSVTPQPRGHDIAVETDAPGILVISEFALDGWRATVDGVAQPLLEANAGLMALPIPAGSHAVTLRYRPLDVVIGAAVSLLALVAAVVLLRQPIVLEPRALRGSAIPAPARTRPAAASIPRLRQGVARPALVAILVLGFGLRVYRLGEQELRGDEAFSYVFTQLETAEVIPELVRQGDPHPPLHYLLLNVWTGLAGDSEMALRYPSAAAGTLLLAALYALGRRMGGHFTGLAAAGLAALSPGLIWLSQDTRNQYALVMLFTALATLIIVKPSHRRAIYWAGYLAACVLTAYTHYYGAFALAAHGLYLWLAPGRRRNLRPWAASGLLAAALLGLWLVPATQNVLAAGQLADPSWPDLARHLTDIGRDLVGGQSLDGGVGRWLFLGAAALAAGGGVALARSGRREWAAMLAGWVLLGSYAIFLVRFSRGTFNSFYGSIVAPAWWLLIAAALVALWQFGGRRRGAAVLSAVVLLGAMAVSLGNYYFDPQHSRSLGYRQVAEHLAEAAGPDDVLIVPFPDPGWNYYLRNSALPRRMLPATLGEKAAETEATLARLTEEHDRLWFIPYSGWDAENVTGRWLDYHTLSEEHTAEGRMELRVYRPRRVAAEAMTAVDAQLSGTLRLAAAHVTVDGRAVDLGDIVDAAPGSPVEVTLLWAGLRPSERSYTVFVHLRDAGGAVIAQHDGIPAFGTRPTPTWDAGETLLDRHEMALPPGASGPATLVVGLYDTQTLEPQPFDGGLAAVPLAEFLIEP